MICIVVFSEYFGLAVFRNIFSEYFGGVLLGGRSTAKVRKIFEIEKLTNKEGKRFVNNA